MEFRPITAGDVLTLGAYTARAFAADHDSDGAVIYDVATRDHRLLYATDTGPGFSAPQDARYDLLLLENSWGDRPVPGATGHHGLASFATTIATLRRAEAIDDGTRIVAIHLGHGNPAPSILRARLEAMGSRTLAGRRGDPTSVTLRRLPLHVPRRTLVLGGARSGKSIAAERLLAAAPAVVYVRDGDLMMRPTSSGASGSRCTRARRPANWTTIETTELAEPVGRARAPTIRRCSSTASRVAVGAMMERVGLWSDDDDATTAESADAELAKASRISLVLAWRTTAARVVAVSNEVGSGVVPAVRKRTTISRRARQL